MTESTQQPDLSKSAQEMDTFAAIRRRLGHAVAWGTPILVLRTEVVTALLAAADRAKELEADARRYRWHRSVGGQSWTVLETQAKATDELFDSATDAAIDRAQGEQHAG